MTTREPDRASQRRLAVVVPTLDERRHLIRHLPGVLDLADEVVVSDGGSTDGSYELAAELGAAVVRGPRGRGAQLNRGAAATDTEILVFLHADTGLTPESVQAIRAAIEDGADGGGFYCRFESKRPIYRLGERLVNLRTRMTRCPLGDQAQFVTREAFDRLGGFRDWPLLEDLDFVRRLRRAGRVAVVGPPVVTSARRYERKGITRTIVVNWTIVALYLLGVAPERLAKLYR